MRKTVICLILVVCTLVFCSAAMASDVVDAVAQPGQQNAEQGAQEQLIEEQPDEPAAQKERQLEPIVLPGAEYVADMEPIPEKYTMAWAQRYAPGSCAPYEEQVGDNGEYPEEVVRPPKDTYRVVVDYHNQAVWAYSKDMYGDYTVLERVMICTTGGNGDWTPEGTYSMNRDYHRFGYFPSFNCYAQYWTQMWGNFYFHSVLYSSRDAGSLSKSSYNGLGTPGSHGCIRMLVPDARWIYENCAPGTLCEVTTVFPRDDQLKSILKHGIEGAIDYVPTEEETEQ